MATKVACGTGPANGWYTLASKASKGVWATKPTTWHWRALPVAVGAVGAAPCGAHAGPATALRTNAAYKAATKPPRGAPVCATCAGKAVANA